MLSTPLVLLLTGAAHADEPCDGVDRSSAVDITTREDVLSGVVRVPKRARFNQKTLTIEPGTTLLVPAYTRLEMGWTCDANAPRTLTMNGRPDAPIRFCPDTDRPLDRPFWGGLNLRCPDDSVEMEHVVIAGAGANDQPALTVNNPARIRNLEVHDSGAIGVHAKKLGPGSSDWIIAGGRDVPVQLGPTAVAHFPDGAYGDNPRPVALVESFAGHRVELFDRGIPYLQLEKRVAMGLPGKTDELVMHAGVEYRLCEGCTLMTGWRNDATTVQIEGTAVNPVVFTSYRGAEAQPGDWDSVQILGGTTPDSRIEHAVFELGGTVETPLLSLRAPVTVSHVTVGGARGAPVAFTTDTPEGRGNVAWGRIDLMNTRAPADLEFDLHRTDPASWTPTASQVQLLSPLPTVSWGTTVPFDASAPSLGVNPSIGWAPPNQPVDPTLDPSNPYGVPDVAFDVEPPDGTDASTGTDTSAGTTPDWLSPGLFPPAPDEPYVVVDTSGGGDTSEDSTEDEPEAGADVDYAADGVRFDRPSRSFPMGGEVRVMPQISVVGPAPGAEVILSVCTDTSMASCQDVQTIDVEAGGPLAFQYVALPLPDVSTTEASIQVQVDRGDAVAETDEQNNLVRSSPLTITPATVDLEPISIWPYGGVSVYAWDATPTVRVRVKNHGTVASPEVDVQVAVAKKGTANATGFVVGSTTLPGVAPNGVRDAVVALDFAGNGIPSWLYSGSTHLRANIADPAAYADTDSSNDWISTEVTVLSPADSTWDLVPSIAASPGTYFTQDIVRMDVEVRNDGPVPAGPFTLEVRECTGMTPVDQCPLVKSLRIDDAYNQAHGVRTHPIGPSISAVVPVEFTSTIDTPASAQLVVRVVSDDPSRESDPTDNEASAGAMVAQHDPNLSVTLKKGLYGSQPTWFSLSEGYETRRGFVVTVRNTGSGTAGPDVVDMWECPSATFDANTCMKTPLYFIVPQTMSPATPVRQQPRWYYNHEANRPDPFWIHARLRNGDGYPADDSAISDQLTEPESD